jgi:hypothetical protein
MENMNDSFDEFVTTIENDDTGTFSGKQKKQLQDMRDQVKNEAARTPPEDYKQMGKKKNLTCYFQEILGDVYPGDDDNGNGECDGTEDCVGNEDGICDKNEQCAEVLDDGIGDDDGVCVDKGKYKEACIEICDPDLIMAVGNEMNVDKGKADDLEQSLQDVTDVIDESNTKVAAFIYNKRLVVQATAGCDKSTMTACEYLECLMSNERKYTANEIEGTVGGAIGAKLFADTCRDGMKWDVISNLSSLCLIPGTIQNGLQIAATTLEVKDDSQTAERLDAIGMCVHETGDKIQQVKTTLEDVIELLLSAPGKREAYPVKQEARQPNVTASQPSSSISKQSKSIPVPSESIPQPGESVSQQSEGAPLPSESALQLSVGASQPEDTTSQPSEIAPLPGESGSHPGNKNKQDGHPGKSGKKKSNI